MKKVLFIGVGLTDYYNQVLNKLDKQPGIKIWNLVEAAGQGHTGAAVHQTTENVGFEIIYTSGKTYRPWSEFRYRGLKNLDKIIDDLAPHLIVSSETYLTFLMTDGATKASLRKHNTKIIMKDIPFRLPKYQDALAEIRTGKAYQNFRPFFADKIETVSRRLKLAWALGLVKNILHWSGFTRLYQIIWARRIMFKKLVLKKRLLNFPDAHVAYVEAAYEIFGSYGVPKEKIFIIYNSPDTDYLFEVRKELERQSVGQPNNPQRLIHIGRLIPWKRVDMLIRALAQLKPEFPQAELIIVGTGPEEGSLKKLVRELTLETSVKFLGGLYRPEEIGAELLAAGVYVLAGMGGISINDAMIFGKPVICSVCDGTEKKLVYHNKNGLYFKDGDQESLVAAIRRLLSDPNLIKTMGQNSTEIIRNEINIHTVIKGYLDSFAYVTKSHVPRT